MAAEHCQIYVYSVSFMHSFCPQRINDTHSHPNIVQIYGAARSGRIFATLYHDGAHLAWNVVLYLCFTFDAELVPFQQYVDGYRSSHFATVYFYACCVRVRFNPSIEPHFSKDCGFPCMRFAPLLKSLTPGQAADNYVHSTTQRLLVSLLSGYLTSLIIIQVLERMHGVDTSLLWPALCRPHTIQYPPASLQILRNIALAKNIQCIRYGAHGR
jgi:hypothetical protein